MARERSVSDVSEVLALGWSFRGEIVYASHVRYVPCHPLRSLLFKDTNFCVFCDLEKSAKFKDRKIYTACASGAALLFHAHAQSAR